MIKLNGNFLNNPSAINAIRKLYHAPGMPATSAYRLCRIYEKVMSELRSTGEKAIAIHKKYCLLDESGEPTGLKEGRLQMKEPKEENEKLHDKEFEELLAKEFEVKALKIPVADLGNSLTPVEIDALSEILEA